VSAAILLATAAWFVIVPLEDLVARVLIFLAVLALAIALSSWGLSALRKRVLREVAARKPAEEKA
jgi:thiol:disulfide interchange protein